VSSRREGTRIYYRAATSHVRNVLEEAGLVAGYLTGVIDPPDDRGAGRKAKKEEPAQVAVRVSRKARAGAARLRPAGA